MEHIIQIHAKDVNRANEAYAEFMRMTEGYLNDLTSKDHTLYKDSNGYKLERVTCDALKHIAPCTPFRPDDIQLVSGRNFPDITATQYYGVEVKSTQSDSWTSVGSSIVESSRIETVERIYMMFGKLGGERAEFRCRPYQECLSSIGVTHSPRYMIDMSIASDDSSNIFSKLGVEYETFRKMNEKDKVQMVRDYYVKDAQSRGKVEMPWWIGEQSVSMNLSFFSDQSMETKRDLLNKIYVLFPDVLDSDFKQAALWLCSRHGILNPSMRDMFSAGGKVDVNGRKVSAAVGRLFEHRKEIINILKNPDADIISEASTYWGVKADELSLLTEWTKRVSAVFDKEGLSVEEFFE